MKFAALFASLFAVASAAAQTCPNGNCPNVRYAPTYAPAAYPGYCPSGTCPNLRGGQPSVAPSGPKVSWTDPTGVVWGGSAEAIAVIQSRFGGQPTVLQVAPKIVPAPAVLPSVTTPPVYKLLPDSGGKQIGNATEALDLVNAQRKANGLLPYAYDEGLTKAAAAAAEYRAANRISVHTSNDFAFLPAGSRADAAGCAAWKAGFGACCVFDTAYHVAGAAFCVGTDGLRYCHLFVRR